MDILIFFVVLLVIILVHEFGHFIVAKKSGIRVDEFGFGFPPKLFGKKIGETEYTFNLLPIGGFVKIFGESPDKESISGPDSERSFVNKPKYIQAAVLAAGVMFNFLLACLIFITIYVVGAPYSTDNIPKGGVVENPHLTITGIETGAPAQLAGLNPGDVPLSLKSGGDILENPTDVGIQQFVAEHSQDEIIFAYRRGNTESFVSVIPIENEELGRPAIGIAMGEVGTLKLPFHRAILEGIKRTVILTGEVSLGLFELFKGLLSGNADFESVSGPVGIVNIVGDAAQIGIMSVMILTALISINLAIINLLPLPALDGGRLFFLLIEAITKKTIKPEIANAVNSIGFFLLLLLMAVVTYKDIVKLL